MGIFFNTREVWGNFEKGGGAVISCLGIFFNTREVWGVPITF